MDKNGWLERFTFRAFTTPVTGTVLIVIGEAWNPHRVTAVVDKRVDVNGWSGRLHFYAWPKSQPNTVMVAVAHAKDPSRCKFVLGRHVNETEDPGWSEIFVFWAYR